MKQLKIALDVSRLIDSFRKNWQYKGITKYTETLYDMLCQSDCVQEVAPIIYSNWSKYPITKEEQEFLQNRLRMPLKIISDEIPMENNEFDIYHSTVNPLPSNKLTNNVPRVITIFDLIHLKFPEFTTKPIPPIQKTINSIDPINDYVICISDCTRKDFSSYVNMNDSHIRIVPRATDELFSTCLSRFEQNDFLFEKLRVNKGKYLLVLGQIEVRKNIFRIIDSFSIISKKTQFSEYILIMVCEDRFISDIENYMFTSGIEKSKYRLIPNVDTNILALLYKNASVFVYISLYEGFGIPILEAMGCGCPMIVSNTGSIPEVAGNAGYYVDPYSIESIVEGIISVLSQEELRKKLSKSGIERATKFSWNASFQKTMDYYYWIIQNEKKKGSN